MQPLIDLIHALSGLGPWGCLGLALIGVILIAPVVQQRGHHRDRVTALRQLTPEQLAVYHADPAPAPVKHVGLVLLAILLAGALAAAMAPRLLVRAQAAGCKADSDCARGERCVSGVCSMSCAGATVPRSSFDVDDRPVGLPVYSSGWIR